VRERFLQEFSPFKLLNPNWINKFVTRQVSETCQEDRPDLDLILDRFILSDDPEHLFTYQPSPRTNLFDPVDLMLSQQLEALKTFKKSFQMHFDEEKKLIEMEKDSRAYPEQTVANMMAQTSVLILESMIRTDDSLFPAFLEIVLSNLEKIEATALHRDRFGEQTAACLKNCGGIICSRLGDPVCIRSLELTQKCVFALLEIAVSIGDLGLLMRAMCLCCDKTPDIALSSRVTQSVNKISDLENYRLSSGQTPFPLPQDCSYGTLLFRPCFSENRNTNAGFGLP